MSKQYERQQAKWLKNTGLKEGDKLIVIATAKDGQGGWSNVWMSVMDTFVGLTVTYLDVADERGVRVDVPAQNWPWRFPFFVLAKVEE